MPSSQIYQSDPVTLINAELIALPTTAIVIVPALGSGKLIQMLWALLIKDFSAAGYTADPDAFLSMVADPDDSFNFISIRAISAFISQQSESSVTLYPAATVNAGGITLDASNFPALPNTSLAIGAQNGGSPTFGGGNAANTLTVIASYQVVSL